MLALAAKRIDTRARLPHHGGMSERTWGQTLRQAMDDNGQTCGTVAKRLGVTRAAVSGWCRDVSAPRVAAVDALVDLLGVDRPQQRKVGRPRNA